MANTQFNNVGTMFNGDAPASASPAAWPQAGMQFVDPGGANPAMSWPAGAGHPASGWAPQPATSKLVVFGDLLSDNGNAAGVQASLGNTPDYVLPPYSPTGDFSDGDKWTTDLARSLGMQPLQQQNFAYEGATGGSLGNATSAVNPAGGLSPLDTFVALPHFAWIMPLSEGAVAAGRSWRDRNFAVSAA